MRISARLAADTNSQPDKGQEGSGNVLTECPKQTSFLYMNDPSTSMTGALASTASCILYSVLHRYC